MATIKTHHALEHTANGRAVILGMDTRRVPIEKTTGTTPATAGQRYMKEHIIAAGAEVELWNGTVEGALRDFAIMGMQIVGEGQLELALYADTPESESDLTPSGDNPKWIPQGRLSCASAREYDHNRVKINPTNNTLVGTDGDGKPNVFTSGSSVSGKWYKASVQNDTASAVTLVFYICE